MGLPEEEGMEIQVKVESSLEAKVPLPSGMSCQPLDLELPSSSLALGSHKLVADDSSSSNPSTPNKTEVKVTRESDTDTSGSDPSNSNWELHPGTGVNLVVNLESRDFAGELVENSGRNSNMEIRRLRTDILRSTYQSIPHSKCQEAILKLRKRVIKLNLELDRNKSQMAELQGSRAYTENGVSMGLIRLMENLQDEKQKLMMDLETKSMELLKCIAHGEFLQDKLDSCLALEGNMEMPQSSGSQVQSNKAVEELEQKIQCLEKQSEESQTKHKEVITDMNLRLENLNDKVARLEAENEILRKENDASRSHHPHSPNFRNRNTNNGPHHSSFRKHPSNSSIPPYDSSTSNSNNNLISNPNNFNNRGNNNNDYRKNHNNNGNGSGSFRNNGGRSGAK